MQGEIEHISICGILTAVPENEVSNRDYISKIQNRRIKKQILLTGIDKRRVTVGGQRASDLAAVAADQLLDRLEWNRDDIDVIIFVTQSPDLSRPSSAFLIQDRLGISKECMVYDINQGCAGYIVGLTTICSILQVTKGKGLLLVGESNAIAGEGLDRGALLEGDAAAATALQYDEDAASIKFANYSDGSRADYLYKPFENYGFMDGNAVLLFGLSDVADAVKKFMSDHNVQDENLDYYVFHQAQKMIVDGIVQEVGVTADKVLMSCQSYGNTSSASVPLTVCLEKGQRNLSGKKKVLLCGYGIGLTWGIILLDLDMDVVFPIVESSYIYQDRKKFGL
ncbi:MAG: ketoacyl-ACP synthase III [Ruminococcus flavefaciens]|nr:ketoacyl-ACP synthase III [Ruminococcus flavefaciens]